jgi:hypothetical protein
MYYSEDVSPGGIFSQYNKDPNSERAINRYDFESGETENHRCNGGRVHKYPETVSKPSSIKREYALPFKESILRNRREEWPVYDKLNKDQQVA